MLSIHVTIIMLEKLMLYVCLTLQSLFYPPHFVLVLIVFLLHKQTRLLMQF
uniref:Uncharacterized protein n=1 Tax=Rhizophora mucronata TaxID=61149 RepID=A0A2P2NWC7_RHIMU